jgi:hyperosmotically inducible protein
MRPACLVLAFVLVCPAALLASADLDRRIERTARESYNFRTVFRNVIHIEAQEGVVTLRGVLPDQNQKTLAENTVLELPGVIRVENEITVPAGPVAGSDEWIARRIKEASAFRLPGLANGLNVQVSDGVAVISGVAASETERAAAEDIAREIAGVRSVTNRLSVTTSASAAPDEIDDASLTAQVKSSLSERLETRGARFKVSARDGVVSISDPRESASPDEQRRLAAALRAVPGMRGVSAQTKLE